MTAWFRVRTALSMVVRFAYSLCEVKRKSSTRRSECFVPLLGGAGITMTFFVFCTACVSGWNRSLW